MKGLTDLLVPITFIGLGIAIVLPAVDGCYREHRVYSEAETLAIQSFGDRKAPLTENERKEWYQTMGIDRGSPTEEQLEKFVQEYKK
jgi:hypothetical protein